MPRFSQLAMVRLLGALAVLALLLPSWLPLAPLSPQPLALAQSVPGGGAVYYVTERFDRGIARVNVDAAGHATVINDYISVLPASGPDSVIFDHHGRMLVSNPEAGTLSEIDPNARTITRPTISTTPLPFLADLALDPRSDTVWVIRWSGNTVARVDPASGATTLFQPSGISNLGGIAFSTSGRLFVGSHSGDVFGLDTTAAHVLRSAHTGGSPDGMTFDPSSGHLFTSSCGGLCELAVGTDAAPALTFLRVDQGTDGDGIAADGQGHILVTSGTSVNCLTLATGAVATVASGIKSADDVATASRLGQPPTPTMAVMS